MKIWIYRIFLILCLATVVGFILYNSTRTGEQSAQISQGVTEDIVQIVIPDFDKLEPPVQEQKIDWLHGIIRNLAHSVEFMAFAFFLTLLLATVPFQYGRYSIPIALTLLGSFVFALADETLQGGFVGRGTSMGDVGMDMLGVICGMLGAIILDFIFCRILSKAKNKNHGD